MGTVPKSERSTKHLQYQKLRMRSRGTKEVAAMDSYFAVIRARPHCIAKHCGDTRSFHSALFIQGWPLM